MSLRERAAGRDAMVRNAHLAELVREANWNKRPAQTQQETQDAPVPSAEAQLSLNAVTQALREVRSQPR